MTSPECRNGTERCAEALASAPRAGSGDQFPGRRAADAARLRRGADRRACATTAMHWSRRRRCGCAATRCARSRRKKPRAGSAGPRSSPTTSGHALYFSKRLIPHLPARCAGRRDVAGAAACRCLRLSARGAGTLCRDAGQRARDTRRARAAAVPRRRRAGRGRRCRRRRPFALRELNNPEDVAPIEQALAEAGLE